MQHVSAAALTQAVHDASASGRSWHIHLLTPACQLNEADQYQLMLEDVERNAVLVCETSEPQSDLAKQFTTLLHGSDVVEGSHVAAALSTDEQSLIAHADDLSARSILWHHHVLFPDCTFNDSTPSWLVLLHSAEGTLSQAFNEEPRVLLTALEPRFYAQSKPE